MNKLKLSALLLASALSANAQDTTCGVVKQNEVLTLDYETKNIISVKPIDSANYFNVKKGEILYLHLNTGENVKLRVVKLSPKGYWREDYLWSKDNHYYSYEDEGPMTVIVYK
tara:strand:- start:11 stop:349 length:339 start_codon:yes stop_codon:yes gene_type:complete